MTCEPLPRELTEAENTLKKKLEAEWKELGKCPHLVVHLYSENSGPYHGCVICGELVA